MNAGSSENRGDDGEPAPTGELMTRLYDDLREVASGMLRRERAGHSLQPTALVHEAYLRLAQLHSIEWRSPRHFAAAAAGAIRRVLVDHARVRATAKRGRGWARMTLNGTSLVENGPDVDLLTLEDALAKLAALDARKARVVELRFFGGMTLEEVAQTLDKGTTTIENDWAFAQAWLRREISRGAEQ